LFEQQGEIEHESGRENDQGRSSSARAPDEPNIPSDTRLVPCAAALNDRRALSLGAYRARDWT